MTARRTRAPLDSLGLEAGTPIVIHLRDPKERVWGALLSLDSRGVLLRGIDVRAFDEWLRQEAQAQDERLLGLATLFYPMHRIERVERDETIGPVEGHAARLERATGRPLAAFLQRDARDV